MRHAAEPIVACLQLRHAGRDSSTPAEEEGTAKGDRQNEQRKEASVRLLGDVMRRTREWMAPNVYYSRIHSSSLPLWRGGAASGRSEAQGREGQASALRWPATNNSAPLASTLLRTTYYPLYRRIVARWDTRPPHSLAVASSAGPCVTGSEA